MDHKTRNALRSAYTIIIAVVGSTVVLFGVLLLFLPGPGTAVVFAGLAILASEFAWARRLMRKAKKELGKGLNGIRK